MGRDCYIIADPENTRARIRLLDRWYCFDEVYKHLGLDCRHTSDLRPADTYLKALTSAPIDSDYSDDRKEYIRHWRNEAARFVRGIIKRFGPECPICILDEEFMGGAKDYCGLRDDDPIAVKWRNRNRQRRERATKEANALVYEWLEEKKRTQYERESPLTYSEFIASRQ